MGGCFRCFGQIFHSRKCWCEWLKGCKNIRSKGTSHLFNFLAVHGATLIDNEDNVLRYARKIWWSKVMNKVTGWSLAGGAKKKLSVHRWHSWQNVHLIFVLKTNSWCTLMSPTEAPLLTSYAMTKSPFIPLASQLSHDLCWSIVG